jgi:hydroxymethylbilane synthase
MDTRGDRVLDRPLTEIGGKGLFTEEIERGLLAGSIDIAVHSLKDLPTALPPGLGLGAVLEREDPRDALIARVQGGLAALPQGAKVGTASLRRQAQLLARRPDLVISVLRGNVGTRLRRVAEGDFDATILAMAGLKRLGRADAATAILSPDDMLPAVGQGIIAVECRADDTRIRDRLASIDHGSTHACARAERALLARLDGSCRTPIAALAEFVAPGRLKLRGLVASPDGREMHRSEAEGSAGDAVALGRDLGSILKAAASSGIFRTT